MTCRSLHWIAAAAVSIGAATSTPSLVVAEPDAGWTVTIDEPAAGAVVATKHLAIHGTVSHGGGVDGVTVTVVPQGLPPQCGPESGPADVDGQSFAIELDVGCNGPHEIQVVVESAGDTASGEPRIAGVEERPPQPAPPGLDVTGEGGLRATWDPGDDPDADGTVLVVNFREDLFGPGIGEATLPPADRRAAVAVRTLRWGAGGPGTTISSPESNGTLIGESNPQGTNEPPPSEPLPPADGPTSTDGGGTTTPPSGTSAPSTTVPAGPRDGQPVAPVAIGPEPDRHPSTDTEERAVSTPPGGGLVRTTTRRTPGLTAPIALALVVVVSVAAWIARHTRRTHPRS